MYILYRLENLKKISRLKDEKQYIWDYNSLTGLKVVAFVVNSPWLKNTAIIYFKKFNDSNNYIWKILLKETNYIVALVDTNNFITLYVESWTAKDEIFSEFHKSIQKNFSHLKDKNLILDDDQIDENKDVFSNVSKSIFKWDIPKTYSDKEYLENVKKDPIFAEEFIKNISFDSTSWLSDKIKKDYIITEAMNSLIEKVTSLKTNIDDLIRIKNIANQIEYPYAVNLQKKIEKILKNIKFNIWTNEELKTIITNILKDSISWKGKLKIKQSGNSLKTNNWIISFENNTILCIIKDNLSQELNQTLQSNNLTKYIDSFSSETNQFQTNI